MWEAASHPSLRGDEAAAAALRRAGILCRAATAGRARTVGGATWAQAVENGMARLISAALGAK